MSLMHQVADGAHKTGCNWYPGLDLFDLSVFFLPPKKYFDNIPGKFCIFHALCITNYKIFTCNSYINHGKRNRNKNYPAETG